MAGTARFELAMAESKSDVLPVTLRPNILLLMEVNLVFSNHPETRKEVLHFYDYSSRGYMLPILHARDSMLQIVVRSGKATFSLVPMTSSTSQSHKGIGF